MDNSEAQSATASLFENFSLFGGSSKETSSKPSSDVSATVEDKKKAAETAAIARKQEAEAKRSAATEAAKERALQVQSAKEAREAAAQRRKEEAEANRATAAEAAKQRALDAQAAKEERLAEVQRRKEEAKAKRAAAAKASQAQQAVKTAKASSTISLFGFGVNDESSQAKPISKAPARSTAKAPRGVPVISKWRENRDGSISGFISGSPAFDDGDAVTTSPIVKGSVGAGSVVQTGSGSRWDISYYYFTVCQTLIFSLF